MPLGDAVAVRGSFRMASDKFWKDPFSSTSLSASSCINIFPWILIFVTTPTLDPSEGKATTPPSLGRESKSPIKAREAMIEDCCSKKLSRHPFEFRLPTASVW